MGFIKALLAAIEQPILEASREQEHEIKKKNSIEVEFRVLSDGRQELK